MTDDEPQLFNVKSSPARRSGVTYDGEDIGAEEYARVCDACNRRGLEGVNVAAVALVIRDLQAGGAAV